MNALAPATGPLGHAHQVAYAIPALPPDPTWYRPSPGLMLLAEPKVTTAGNP